MSIRAGLYLRVSTEEQAREGVSLAAQEGALVAFCRSQGWQVGGLYVDDGYSGKNIDRPAMQRMLADCEAKKLDLVLVYKLDRLSRRQRDCLHLLEDVFDRLGVGFKSATEAFDTTTPFGKAMIGILAVFAQLERETIVERTRMGKQQAAKEGRWHGGTHRITYGYRWEPGTQYLVPDPLTAPVVKDIFRLYTESSMGYETIARYLDEQGHAPPAGSKHGWTFSAIAYIIKNPTYAGMSRFKVNTDRETAFQGKHEPLVSPEVFERAQQLRLDRNVRKANKKTYLLSGIARCAECGGRMRAKRQWINWPSIPKKYHVNYVCYNYLGEPHHLVTGKCDAAYRHGPKVEASFLEWLSHRETDDLDAAAALVEDEVRAAQPDTKALERDLSAIEKQMSEVTKRRQRWDDAYETGRMSLDDVIPRQRRLDDEFGALAKRKTEILAEMSQLDRARVDVGQVVQRLRWLGQEMQGLSREQQWDAVHGLFEEVWIDRGGNIVDVKFRS